MLEVKQVCVNYGDKKVLRGLDLLFQAAEIHGILGMNGSGKTTLFNTLYGFLKPQAGKVEISNLASKKHPIAYLETRNYFYPYLTGREYLQLLSLRKPAYEIDEWNQLFDLPLEQIIDEYSTGMKKKLAFLGTLALDRPILVLDEPFNGVDVESNEKIYQILDRIKGQGKLIILSSHIIEGLTRICDRISYLNEGVIQRTYLRSEFTQLEKELRAKVHQKIDVTLGKLFNTQKNKL